MQSEVSHLWPKLACSCFSPCAYFKSSWASRMPSQIVMTPVWLGRCGERWEVWEKSIEVEPSTFITNDCLIFLIRGTIFVNRKVVEICVLKWSCVLIWCTVCSTKSDHCCPPPWLHGKSTEKCRGFRVQSSIPLTNISFWLGMSLVWQVDCITHTTRMTSKKLSS